MRVYRRPGPKDSAATAARETPPAPRPGRAVGVSGKLGGQPASVGTALIDGQIWTVHLDPPESAARPLLIRRPS